MTDENTTSLVITNRATFDNREIAGKIDTNKLYLVQEGTTESPECLSLYLGNCPQTDILNINDMMDVGDRELTANELNHVLFGVSNKLYVYTDINTGKAKLFAVGGDNAFYDCTAPLTWEEI